MRCIAGAKVNRAGIYNVLHLGHRLPHKAILQERDSFPYRCRCGTAVAFEWVEPVTESEEVEHIGYDPDFMDSILRTFAKAG